MCWNFGQWSARWRGVRHNIKILPEYLPSEKNTAADCLSRLPYVSRIAEFLEKLSNFDVCCLDKLKLSLLSRVEESKE